MFCPICRAEYLPGPKVCSDCQVALVEKLPEEGAAPVDDSGASVKLWAGIDPRTFAAIRTALDESHIAHDDMARESPLSSSNSSEPMQIWIGKAGRGTPREKYSKALSVTRKPRGLRRMPSWRGIRPNIIRSALGRRVFGRRLARKSDF